MRSLPVFRGCPEHLRVDAGFRLRLLLCAKEIVLRYGGIPWLTGSGLFSASPDDWDIRLIVDSDAFDVKGGEYWSAASASITRSLCRDHGLKLDVRIWPSRLWYCGDAVRLDVYERKAALPPSIPAQPDTKFGLELIAQQKDNPELHMLLGSLMYMRGDRITALRAFVRCVQLSPGHAGGWLNIGNIYYDSGDFKRAAVYYRRAMVLNPDYAKAYVNMANTLAQLGVHATAVIFYDKAIELEPATAAAHHNKASCLTNLRRFDEAEAELNRAFEIDPADDRALNTLGNLRMSQENDYAAGAAYSLAIDVNPKYAALYTNMGNIYMNLGQSRLAVLYYERGLVMDPKNPGVRYNLALAYLRSGNYRLGWRAYEGRWGFRELSVKGRDFNKPMWIGEDICGKRILIHGEQGMGDVFQFSRYIPLVARLGATVYVEVQHRLQRIIATVDGIKAVFTRGLELPEFDVHCPLMSMPWIFKTEVHTVPQNIPYIHAWKWEVARMRERWQQTGFRIGISWAGNPKYKKDRERSFSLLEFGALSSVDGVTWFSLQKGEAAKQIDKYKDVISVIDASSNARDFAETAALIDTLDLVIASDSSPVHLAGAMGKPVWMLLAYLPDWRWGESGDTTPWYPNVRLFRQTSPGDWAGVFVKVREALKELLCA